MSGISPQARLIYRALIRRGLMTPKELGAELRMFPQAVYRATLSLREYGLVEQVGDYPRKFKARTVSEGVDSFLVAQRKWFLKNVIGKGRSTAR